MTAPRTVVGAIIVDSLAAPSVVWAARRTRPVELAGRWEFPGGKVEPGETPIEALVREVAEELAVGIRVGSEFTDHGRPWPISDRYELRLWFAEVVDGILAPGPDHDEVRALRRGELDDLPWLPSDARALPRLRELLAGADLNIV